MKDLPYGYYDDDSEIAVTVATEPQEQLTVETINNHIYFYSYVDTDRTLALIKSVRKLDHELRNEFMTRDLPDTHPMTPIWLHVQSGGGGLFAGLAVADQLRQIKSPLYSIVEGYCGSAATLISMSCKERYIQPSAFMLIHQLSSIHWGTYEQLKDEMHLTDMAMERLVKFYTENSRMDEEKIRDLLKRDSWFNAQECVELGLVDKVL